MSNLLPILKSRQELERQKERGMFVEELSSNANSPIIMYGVDKGDHMEYTQSKGDKEDLKIKNQAIKHLEALEIPIHMQEMEGIEIAMVQHEYAAEKILDSQFMKKLAARLGSQSIVVGIPMKGFMVAVAKGNGEANLYGATVKQYNNAQTYPISDSIYYIIDGEIEMVGGNNQKGQIIDENGMFVVSGKNDENGKVGFIAKIGNKDEAVLATQIQKAYQNILLHGMKDPKNFNGKIDFQINPQFNQRTSTLEMQIKKMAKNISERGAAQIMSGLSGEDFKVRFFYGEDQLMAQTNPIDSSSIPSETDELNMKTAATPSKTKTTEPAKSEIKPWWKFW